MKPSATQASNMAGTAATALVAQRPKAVEASRLIAEFDGDTVGASLLAGAVRIAAHEWGVSWTGSAVERLAYAQATWLLLNEHPEATYLYLCATYDIGTQVFELTVGDPGSLLPTLSVSRQWRLSVAGVANADAFHHGGHGRRLRSTVRVRTPWRVRITWNTAKWEGTHPGRSFQDCMTQADLLVALERILHLEAVEAVHWQGPADSDSTWHQPAFDPDGQGCLPILVEEVQPGIDGNQERRDSDSMYVFDHGS